MHSIYIITNTVTGKSYIGQTVDPKKRWSQHRTYAKNNPTQGIHIAMNADGLENFTFEVIETCETLKQANAREVELIALRNTLEPNGYNRDRGGAGLNPSEETRTRISESLKGHEVSEETLAKLSESHKGQVAWNKGMKGLGAGRKDSPEVRARKSEAARKRVAEHPMTEEQKAAISATLTGRPRDPEAIRKGAESNRHPRGPYKKVA
jgi:group I intron endonuclease